MSGEGRRAGRAERFLKRLNLAKMGVKEVCLLGQNVNGYGRGIEGELDFSELLERINEIGGIERIRFTTSHPKDLSEKLIQTFSNAGETL